MNSGNAVAGAPVRRTDLDGIWRPDLAVFAKAVASGFPLAVLAGKRDILELLATGNVMHGGTYNANLPTLAAGLATIMELMRGNGQVLAQMEERGCFLMAELGRLGRKHGHELEVGGSGVVFHPAFGGHAEIRNYRDFLAADAGKRVRFNALLHEEGVRVTARGTWFMSAAHDDNDIEETITAADRAFAALNTS